MNPAPASFAEIHLAHQDLTKVPILISELGKMGEFGDISAQEKQQHLKEKYNLADKVKLEVRSFFEIIYGDERADVTLLVRAVAILTEVMEQSPDAKTKILSGFTDRWIWLTMRQTVDFEGDDKFTFRLDMDREEWVQWVVDEVSPAVVDDGDDFFLSEIIIQNGFQSLILWFRSRRRLNTRLSMAAHSTYLSNRSLPPFEHSKISKGYFEARVSGMRILPKC